tara:strand:+ start:648 stop:1427 length:780 start_codon:yes stop_codon:yes gene_type:complete
MVLTESQINLFHEKGYLKLSGILHEKYALKIQNEIWQELEEEFGIKKDNHESWTTPLHSPKKAKVSTTNEKLINDKFRSIIDVLIGKDTWSEPRLWGGFLVNFPNKNMEEWNLANKLWHWDYEINRDPELGGLLIFSFFSEVLSKGGGTLIVSGSHRALRKFKSDLSPQELKMKHGEHRKLFMKTHPYFKKLTSSKFLESDQMDAFMTNETLIDQIPLQVIELTGKPGDVVFCHPRLIHAPASINLNSFPRIMRTKFLW